MAGPDRSKSARTQDDTAASQGVPDQTKTDDQAQQPAAKNRAGWIDRGHANQADGKPPERGTFAEKRKEQVKESGEEQAVKPRDTPARENQGKTNEQER
jgi:hypothetical protein